MLLFNFYTESKILQIKFLQIKMEDQIWSLEKYRMLIGWKKSYIMKKCILEYEVIVIGWKYILIPYEYILLNRNLIWSNEDIFWYRTKIVYATSHQPYLWSSYFFHVLYIFFYTQLPFLFYLVIHFYIVHDHTVAFFFSLFRTILIPLMS